MYAFGFVSVWMFILTCTLQDPYVPQVMIDYTEVGPLFLESSGNFFAHSFLFVKFSAHPCCPLIYCVYLAFSPLRTGTVVSGPGWTIYLCQ